jgi:hypothetical protein
VKSRSQLVETLMPLRTLSRRPQIVLMLLCLMLFAQLPLGSFAEVNTSVTVEAAQRPALSGVAVAPVAAQPPSVASLAAALALAVDRRPVSRHSDPLPTLRI